MPLGHNWSTDTSDEAIFSTDGDSKNYRLCWKYDLI